MVYCLPAQQAWLWAKQPKHATQTGACLRSQASPHFQRHGAESMWLEAGRESAAGTRNSPARAFHVCTVLSADGIASRAQQAHSIAPGTHQNTHGV
jgi:hypothetical protein